MNRRLARTATCAAATAALLLSLSPTGPAGAVDPDPSGQLTGLDWSGLEQNGYVGTMYGSVDDAGAAVADSTDGASTGILELADTSTRPVTWNKLADLPAASVTAARAVVAATGDHAFLATNDNGATTITTYDAAGKPAATLNVSTPETTALRLVTDGDATHAALLASGSPTSSVWTSDDAGLTWTQRTIDTPELTGNSLPNLRYDGSHLLVSYRTDSGNPTVSYSSAGTSWATVTHPLTGGLDTSAAAFYTDPAGSLIAAWTHRTAGTSTRDLATSAVTASWDQSSFDPQAAASHTALPYVGSATPTPQVPIVSPTQVVLPELGPNGWFHRDPSGATSQTAHVFLAYVEDYTPTAWHDGLGFYLPNRGSKNVSGSPFQIAFYPTADLGVGTSYEHDGYVDDDPTEKPDGHLMSVHLWGVDPHTISCVLAYDPDGSDSMLLYPDDPYWSAAFSTDMTLSQHWVGDTDGCSVNRKYFSVGTWVLTVTGQPLATAPGQSSSTITQSATTVIDDTTPPALPKVWVNGPSIQVSDKHHYTFTSTVSHTDVTWQWQSQIRNATGAVVSTSTPTDWITAQTFPVTLADNQTKCVRARVNQASSSLTSDWTPWSCVVSPLDDAAFHGNRLVGHRTSSTAFDGTLSVLRQRNAELVGPRIASRTDWLMVAVRRGHGKGMVNVSIGNHLVATVYVHANQRLQRTYIATKGYSGRLRLRSYMPHTSVKVDYVALLKSV